MVAPPEGEAPPPGALRQRDPDMSTWASRVADSIDSTTIDAAVQLPPGANVLAARVIDGGLTPAYEFYQGGGGAFTNDFFVASSIKLLAAVGALEFARSQGLTGEASVDGGATIHDIYDAAIRWSSNEDYSELVRIAGVEYLNGQFLPNHGFGATVIQEAYGEDEQVAYSPEMTLSEGDTEVDVPARETDESYGCGGENCTDLFDLADAMRRVTLDAEIPAAERFRLAPSDVAGLQDALLGASGWFEPGVHRLFGPDARIFSKPGWVGGLDCVDTAFVDDVASGHRYLLAASVPDRDGEGCDVLSDVAYDVLSVVSAQDGGNALRTDGSTVPVVGGQQAPPRLP